VEEVDQIRERLMNVAEVEYAAWCGETQFEVAQDVARDAMRVLDELEERLGEAVIVFAELSHKRSNKWAWQKCCKTLAELVR
jgi:hypothetical protein